MFGFLKRRPKPAPPPEVPPLPPPPPLQYSLDVCLRTDVGCHRELNEDCGQIVHSADPASKRILVAVADGMGGHQAGEVASRRMIEVVSRAFHEASDGDLHASLKRAFEQANREIYAQSRDSEGMQGMGTTCTALALDDACAYAAHVGDSRAYLIRNGEIYLMTEDHSAVMQLVKQGALTLEEARHHADKNVIIRAIGSRPEVEVSIWPEPLPVRVADRFLLCSDGLYDRIEDNEIRDIALSCNAAEACDTLIQLAKTRGGFDNITVAIMRLEAPDAESRDAPTTRELEVQT